MKTSELTQSLRVEELLPRHISENNPIFVELMKLYYDWMELEGNVNNIIHNFGNLHEVDFSVSDPFFDNLYQLYLDEYAKNYPYTIQLRKYLFLKNIVQILKNKGSKQSIINFFKTIYGVDVDVTYPVTRRLTYNAVTQYEIKTAIYNPSESEVESKMAVYNQFLGKYVYGEFGADAIIENVTHYSVESGIESIEIVVFTLSNLLNGYFSEGETLTCHISDTQSESFDVGSIITGYRIVSPGTGYTIWDTINIETNGELEPASAIITKVSVTGEIQEIQITNSGFGFSGNVPCTITSAFGSGAEILFLDSTTTQWDSTKSSDKLEYSVNKKSFQGIGNFDPYIQQGYITGGYYDDGSSDPNDYLPSYAISSDIKSSGKWYWELMIPVLDDPIHQEKFLDNLRIGVAKNVYPDNFSGQLGQDLNSWGIDFSSTPQFVYHNNANIFYPLNLNMTQRDIINGVHCYVFRFLYEFTPTSATLKVGRLPSINSTLTTIVSDVNLKDIGISVTGRIPVGANIRMITKRSELLGIIPYGFEPWDNLTNSVLTKYDNSGLVTTSDVIYRYHIKTRLPATIWDTVYKSCIHPSGTKYTVDFYDESYITSDINDDGIISETLQITSSSGLVVKIISKSKTDIGERFNVKLSDVSVIRAGVLGNYSLPVCAFDQDIIINVPEPSTIRMS